MRSLLVRKISKGAAPFLKASTLNDHARFSLNESPSENSESSVADEPVVDPDILAELPLVDGVGVREVNCGIGGLCPSPEACDASASTARRGWTSSRAECIDVLRAAGSSS